MFEEKQHESNCTSEKIKKFSTIQQANILNSQQSQRSTTTQRSTILLED